MFRQIALTFVFSVSLLLGAQDGPAYAQESAQTGLTPEQAKAVADVLRDDATRQALLDQLDKIGKDPVPTDGGSAASAAADELTVTSVSRKIAEGTRQAAEAFAERALLFWEHLLGAPSALSAVTDVSNDVIYAAVIDLALVVIITYAAFYLLRALARRLYRSMGAAAAGSGAIRTAIILAISVIIDAAVVVLAWAIGYAATLVAFGNIGAMSIDQTLFLNAFLIVEMIKVVVRAVLAPTTSDLRPVNLADRPARILSVWSSRLIGLLGYGQMLAVPIINQNVGWLAGRSVSTVISLLVVLTLMALVLGYRRSVADWMTGTKAKRGLVRVLASNWYVPATVYLVFLCAIVLARPGGVLLLMLATTGEVIAAVVAGAIVANLLRRAIIHGVKLPENVKARLPALERRLNGFVPKVLFLLRLVIISAVAAYAVDTIGLFDVGAWLASNAGLRLTEKTISVAFVLLMSFSFWLALASWIDFRLNPEFGSRPTAREQTLLTLLRNAVTVVLLVITLMFALSEIGLDIAPLIASAGVLGLAIGFGSQRMVQDIITGIFIQFENAMNVGDVVTVGGTTGTVERLTIRSVSLRDVQGAFHIIPFSSVDMVSNYMRDYGNYVCDMGIAYREDINDAKAAMLDAFDDLKADPDRANTILGDLQWFGLQAFGDSAVIVRARIKFVPGEQWAVGRAYNEIVKRIFDERGIEIPFPHQTLYFGEDKDGNAPPLHLTGGRNSGVDARADQVQE